MYDQVQTVNSTTSAAKAASQSAGASEQPLADQMQFSTILKHLVDTPEDTLEAAQAPVDPVEARLARRAEQKQEARESGPKQTDEEYAPRTNEEISDDRKADAIETASRPSGDDDSSADDSRNTDDQPAPAADDDDIEPAADLSGDDIPAPVEETAVTPDPDSAATTQTAADAVASAAQSQAPARSTTTESSQNQTKSAAPVETASVDKGAQSQVSGALTDQDFSDLADDLYRAANSDVKPDKQPKSNNSAASALANKQAQDLAQKLGAGTNIEVQVNVANNAAKPNAGLDQNLTSASTLSQLAALTEGETSPTTPSTTNNNGDASGARNKPVDPQLAQNRALQQNANQDQQAFLQLVKAQAAAPQPAANTATLGAKFQPVGADTIQTNATTGPAGPSQVSQTAKANPTTAARQPTPAQAPAEQVALHIKKALGAGADKINIKLHPAELGRVEVKLEIGKDGHIQATVLAEKPETLDMLQRDARGLERALQDAGLRTSSDSLSFSLRNDGQSHMTEAGRNGHRGRGGHPSERRDTPEQERDQGIVMNPNAYGRNMSTNGGVDIRV